MNNKTSLLYCDVVIHVRFPIPKSLPVIWLHLLATAHVSLTESSASRDPLCVCVFICTAVQDLRVCLCWSLSLQFRGHLWVKTRFAFSTPKKSTNIFSSRTSAGVKLTERLSGRCEWACVCGDLGTVVICVFISVCVGRLGYVDHAEELASRFLQCFPKNRLSAQAALHHEYFSHLPPRLWELPDSQSTHITSHHITASLSSQSHTAIVLILIYVCMYRTLQWHTTFLKMCSALSEHTAHNTVSCFSYTYNFFHLFQSTF